MSFAGVERDAQRHARVAYCARNGGSSMQSVMRGTGDIEADYLNGEIVQLGRLHGVETPANVVVQQVGNRMARERLEVGAYTLDDLERLIQSETR